MLESTRGRNPGQWWPTKYPDGRLSATLYCSECEKPMSLANHKIADDGTVTPSVVCPQENVECPRCGFHEFVRLNGLGD